MPLHSRLPRIAARLRSDMQQITHDGAEMVKTRAKDRAPDAPPLGKGLVAAIHVDDSHADDLRYDVVAGDKDVFWGHLQEFGTVHHPAQPFLIPAFEESKREIVKKGRRALRRL